ncbi:MAG: hypothetical protein C4542_09740 [Dehalococcoidia bacterium]|nr:MAG: hypothetical protein C4542_09740 [Dehalococcoidia bacterium]
MTARGKIPVQTPEERAFHAPTGPTSAASDATGGQTPVGAAEAPSRRAQMLYYRFTTDEGTEGRLIWLSEREVALLRGLLAIAVNHWPVGHIKLPVEEVRALRARLGG